MNMCEVLDKIYEKARAEGKVIGMVLTHASYGRTGKEIAELLGISKEKVTDILADN